MNFFKKLFSSFSHKDADKDVAEQSKQRSVLSDYTASTHTPVEPPASQSPNPPTTTPAFTTPNTNTRAPATAVSDVIEHQVKTTAPTQLDILIDALELNKRKFVVDRGVVSIPFDSSGCDFDTKRQLACAVSKEFGLMVNEAPSGIACTECAKRIFRSIKASQDESLVCGCLFVSISQDIDSDGYMLAEITNVQNGNSVFFDIPATIADTGSIDIDYELITTNIVIAKDKVT